MQFSKAVLGSAIAAALLSGCQSGPITVIDPATNKVVHEIKVYDPYTHKEIGAEAKAETVSQLFEVEHEGRYYSFYDFATYQSFLDVGETAYRLTRIGGGAHGETLVFGLAKADKKKGAETPAAMLWDGKAEAESDFYGEMRKHGRIYVFSSKEDMDAVRQIGEPSYMYTDIGGGPKGETVVFVLNKSNKKHKPEALIAKFKTLNPAVEVPAAEPAPANTTQLFEVEHEGRYYSFYDFATYQSFLDVGETAYRLTRIGGGPNGETLVFGLAKADKKQGAETPAAMLWDGKAEVEGDFYGEMRKHGRIYVFSTKEDMDAVRQIGEPSYMYTDIGGGPKGETVVFVLNKSNKKHKPVALMEKFNKLHPAPAVQEAEASTQLFDVVHEGRYYSFYDFATYQSFLDVGETAYRLTRIGGGPNGETLVFGLAKADKKQGAETPAAMIWDGKAEVEGDFYGEMRKHGRIYVFSTKEDMDAVRQIGEPSYMYTQIGAGPKGETVVFVLNKSNKKHKPVALMAKYNEIHGVK